MGILGKNVKLHSREVRVAIGFTDDGQVYELVMRPPSLGKMDEANEVLPEPEAPVITGKDGKPVVMKTLDGMPLFDDNGQEVYRRNFENADYKRAVERRTRAFNTALIVFCIDHDGNPGLQMPESLEEWDGTAVDYYHHIWAQFEEAGVDVAAYRALSQAAAEMTRPMTAGDVESAKKSLQIDTETQTAIKEDLQKQGHEVPAGNSA